MILDITEVQAKQMAVNAVNASVPMGMGFLHFEDREYTIEDVDPYFRGGIAYFDYFHGRMIQLNIRKVEGGYSLPDTDVNIEHQSWARKYPTYEALAASVVTPS